jgi:hypothetical protein
MSFDAGSLPDFKRVRELMTDDAIILVRASSEDIETINADESIQRIRSKIENTDFSQFGLRFTLKKVDCTVTNVSAYCVSVVETTYPGLTNYEPVLTTDLTTLRYTGGRWLATTSALFVSSPDVAPQSILSYPVNRKDEPRVAGRKWDRALPFLAQRVIDLGYDLPKPYGISIIPVVMRQDMILTNLDVSINDGPVSDIDFVNFGTPSSDSQSLQLKLDAWLFPFMNIYGAFGWVEGGADVPVIFKGGDLLEAAGLEGLCDGSLLQPDFCVRTIAAEVRPLFRGKSFTVGANLATGWKKMFVVLPFSYTWTDLEGKDDNVEAYTISPRIGVNSEIGEWGVMSTYIGATYLDSTNTVVDTFYIDTSDSGVPGLGDTTPLDYKIDQTNKDKWNYLIGFNWNITSTWSAQAEAGFGGSRSNFISSVTYRY